MIIDDQHYDVIIVGTGAGGGTLAYKLAPSGKRILVLERGDFLPREEENWQPREVFKGRYQTQEQWYDRHGEPFRPQTHYWVGGNTKVYGGALLRMREQDFHKVEHLDGVSPEWELKYGDFEPFYTQAEILYKVRGRKGEDPTEPPRSTTYISQPISHEPRMQEICDAIAEQGLHPFHLPLGIKLNQKDGSGNADCVRCKTCDGYPCKVDGKSDAEVDSIRPAMEHPNLTLRTNAKVVCLHTSTSGKEVKAVEAEINGESFLFFGDVVVLSCGAVNSAALLLRSANEQHPDGLANSSGLVGRNFMKHLMTAVVQLTPKVNPDIFQKTICVNDFYWGDDDFNYPMGHIQNTGNLLHDMIATEAPPIMALLTKFMPGFGLQQIATRTVGWWLQTEDLPDPDNRVRLQGDKLYLDYTANNLESHDRLLHRWIEVLKNVDHDNRGFYPYSEAGIQVVAHQSGTCRFGSQPDTSVLDLNCRTHDLDNLYVVDSSFFPSLAAVSPALTVIANALRVGEHLLERLQ
ncbi:GMC oxidoreductase [Calothrix sp. 336/3]|uniref:GMC oxidoreductase n=1 Tax=Calothrix sp. 336/3 TaxID=1337936 RepID=UPI0004E3D3AD|nr:GMC family oxidoreductase [Calothrix sp. 336/3]AKG22489.1 dehydrogenase [Calothrix sp. 336/3]